jgi:hypothetical protein
VALPIRPIQISAALRMARRPCSGRQIGGLLRPAKRLGFTQLGQFITRLKLPAGKIDRSNFKMEVQCPLRRHSPARFACPLWVNSGHFAAQSQCPLYPESGHCSVSVFTVLRLTRPVRLSQPNWAAPLPSSLPSVAGFYFFPMLFSESIKY